MSKSQSFDYVTMHTKIANMKTLIKKKKERNKTVKNLKKIH